MNPATLMIEGDERDALRDQTVEFTAQRRKRVRIGIVPAEVRCPQTPAPAITSRIDSGYGGRTRPRSVMIAVTSLPGVRSKAGLRAGVPGAVTAIPSGAVTSCGSHYTAILRRRLKRKKREAPWQEEAAMRPLGSTVLDRDGRQCGDKGEKGKRGKGEVCAPIAGYPSASLCTTPDPCQALPVRSRGGPFHAS